jgi:hypothetical protein
LESRGIKWSGWVFNKPLRYRESAIESGTELYVLGDATENPDAKPSADHTQNILITKGSNKIFFISTKAERKITMWMGIGGWIAIIAGFIFGFGSIIASLVTLFGLVF